MPAAQCLPHHRDTYTKQNKNKKIRGKKKKKTTTKVGHVYHTVSSRELYACLHRDTKAEIFQKQKNTNKSRARRIIQYSSSKIQQDTPVQRHKRRKHFQKRKKTPTKVGHSLGEARQKITRGILVKISQLYTFVWRHLVLCFTHRQTECSSMGSPSLRWIKAHKLRKGGRGGVALFNLFTQPFSRRTHYCCPPSV